MHRRIFLITTLLFVSINISFWVCADEIRSDGNWWRTLDYTSQACLIIGFFDGMNLGHQFSVWGFYDFDEPSQKQQEAFELASQSYKKYTSKYTTHVTNIQLVDGLNEFYSDFKNRKIVVFKAVWLVLQQIAGKPAEEMDKIIESWRRHAD